MEPTKADEHAARLKGLLPKMTDAQLLDWAQRFERYDEGVARAAVDRYINQYDELKTPLLRSMLEAEENRRRVVQRKVNDDIADEWVTIDATVLNLPAPELERLTTEVLAD